MKKIMLVLILPFLFACFNDKSSDTEKEKTASSIEFSIAKTEYAIGETIDMDVEIYDEDGELMDNSDLHIYYNDIEFGDSYTINEAGIYTVKAICDSVEKDEKIYVFNRDFQVKDREDIVMYEINPRAFSIDGSLDGITEKLDYIEELGINTIWLMPTYPVGQIDKKGVLGSLYSVSDYTKVNPEMGTMEDFNELVIEAHKRDIAVIMDWVANHTAWDHPWVTFHKYWYTQDSNGNIVYPSTWTDVADLNFNNTDMQDAMIDDMKYWFKKSNIDGFRCDAADLVPMSFWEKATEELEGSVDRDIILLAEGSNPQLFISGFQMNYAWKFYSNLKGVFNGSSAVNLINSNESEYSVMIDNTDKLRFTTNHDETAWDATPISIFHGTEGAKAASVIATYLDGVPLFYNGQEVGCTDKTEFFDLDPIDWTENLDMLDFYKKLIAVYNENEALRKGSIGDYSSSDISVFTKTYLNDEVLVIVNVREQNINYSVDSSLRGDWTDLMDNSSLNLGKTLGLGAYEYKILKK